MCKKSSNADANVRPPSDFEKCKAKVRRDAGSSRILAPCLVHDKQLLSTIDQALIFVPLNM